MTEQEQAEKAEPKCPKCGGGNYEPHHHAGSFAYPECDWYECDDCGYRTDPE